MALMQHNNRQLHGGEPARHFKPQSKRQLNEVLRKIDIAEAEMEITLMQLEHRATQAVDNDPDPYRLLEFGMLTRPEEYTPECNPPSTVHAAIELPNYEDVYASADRRATAMVLALYLLAVLAAAYLVFGGRP